MYKVIVILGLVLLPCMAVAQDEITVGMTVSKDMIGLDEQVILSISVSGSQQNLPEPQMPNMSMFEVYSQGTSTNISIVNGRMETSVGYNYVLFPKRKGTFVIKPAVVVHNQKRFVSNEVTITVVDTPTAPGQSNQVPSSPQSGQQAETRDVFLVTEVNKKRPYVNEQITLTVKLYHAVRIYSNPEYAAPQITGFWSESLGSPRTYTEMIDGRRYGVYEQQMALFPTRSGELEIGSAMMSVVVPVKRERRRYDPFGDNFFDGFFNRGETKTVRSRPITIEARSLPADGRPDNFSGTVGNFKISQTANKTEVDVNDPVTVTYRIHGTGNIKTVAEPAIEENLDFRIFPGKTDEKISPAGGLVGGTKIFEKVFFPKRAGQLKIPGTEFNYFDPKAVQYRTIAVKPIDLNVNPSPIADLDETPSRTGVIVDSKLKDILYIKTEADDLARKKPLILFRPVYLAVNLIPVLVLAVVLVGRRRQDKLNSDIGYARSRAAKKMARRRLSRAGKMVKSGNTTEFYGEIRNALFSYVADKMDISPHGLTGDRVLEIINEFGGREETVGDTRELLKRADFAQYAPSSVSSDQIRESLKLAEKVLIGLEEAKIG